MTDTTGVGLDSQDTSGEGTVWVDGGAHGQWTRLLIVCLNYSSNVGRGSKCMV